MPLRHMHTTEVHECQVNSSETHSENHNIPASVSYFVGSIMATVFTFGFLENCTVLLVYARNPKLKTVNNCFIIGLCLSDTGQIVFNIPLVIVACFSRRWIFGHSACLYIGFVTTFFGLTQISLLCIIALERYFIIVHQARRLSATKTKAVLTIACCYVYGAFWALGPLFGWSEYKLVAAEISCSINWTIKNNFYLSYILLLFAFVWFVPLSIIIFGYIRIAMLVFSEKSKRVSMRSSLKHRKTSRERRVALTVLIMIGAFVVSWTPYSIIALMSAFGNLRHSSNAIYLAPAVFAKASIIWNPLIYTARHSEFRCACKHSLRRLFTRVSQEVSQRDNMSSNSINGKKDAKYSEKSSDTRSIDHVLKQNGFPCGVVSDENASVTSVSDTYMACKMKARHKYRYSLGYAKHLYTKTEDRARGKVIGGKSRAKSVPDIKQTINNDQTISAQVLQMLDCKTEQARREKVGDAHFCTENDKSCVIENRPAMSEFATSVPLSEAKDYTLYGSNFRRNSNEAFLADCNKQTSYRLCSENVSEYEYKFQALNDGQSTQSSDLHGINDALYASFLKYKSVEKERAFVENGVVNERSSHFKRRRRKFSNIRYHRFLDIGEPSHLLHDYQRLGLNIERRRSTLAHTALRNPAANTRKQSYDVISKVKHTTNRSRFNSFGGVISMLLPTPELMDNYDSQGSKVDILRKRSLNVKQTMV